MNIIDKGLLWFFLLPNVFYKRLGIQIFQLKAILILKLTMDDRRPNSFQQTKHHKATKPVSKATLVTMLLSAFMGCLYLLCFFAGKDAVTQCTFFFFIYIVLLSLTLITDFTQILMDVRDNQIILPKPVNDITFVTARILHIGINIFKIMLPMALPASILIGIRWGLVAVLVFILATLLATIFTIFLINALYLLILRVSNPEKFKNIISYIQIGFSILIYGSYQILPRLFENSIFNNFIVGSKAYHLWLPPYWFAALWGWATGHTSSIYITIAASFLAVMAPLVGIIAVVKYFAPTFNLKLSQITGSSAESKTTETTRKNAGKSWIPIIAERITQSAAEKMGFLFTWKMMVRSRDFKLKVYPGIGYILVIAVAGVLRSENFSLQTVTLATNPVFIITTLYFPCLILFAAIGNVANTNHYKAAWMYNIAPLSQPGLVISGMMKAILIHFMLPIVVLMVIFALVSNTHILLLHIATAFAIQIVVFYSTFFTQNAELPFSKPLMTAEKGGNTLKMLLFMLLPFIAGITHYLVKDYWWAVAIMLAIALAAIVLLHRSVLNITWKRIKLNSDF